MVGEAARWSWSSQRCEPCGATDRIDRDDGNTRGAPRAFWTHGGLYPLSALRQEPGLISLDVARSASRRTGIPGHTTGRQTDEVQRPRSCKGRLLSCLHSGMARPMWWWAGSQLCLRSCRRLPLRMPAPLRRRVSSPRTRCRHLSGPNGIARCRLSLRRHRLPP